MEDHWLVVLFILFWLKEVQGMVLDDRGSVRASDVLLGSNQGSNPCFSGSSDDNMIADCLHINLRKQRPRQISHIFFVSRMLPLIQGQTFANSV